MSVTHTITRTYKDQSSNSLSKVESITSDKENNLSKSLSAGTNTNVLWKTTRSKLKSLCISVSTAATIYTNDLSSGSPQDTIALTAGQVFIWTLAVDTLSSGPLDCPFSNDVNTLYVTNAATCVLDIRALEAAT